jgi:hypothetical protein
MRRSLLPAAGIVIALVTAACSPTAPAPSAQSSSSASSAPAPAASSGPARSPSASTAASAPPATKSSLSAPVVGDVRGRLRLSSVLTGDGAPIAGAAVMVDITSLGETYQVLKLRGIVPKPAESLIVQLGFNNQPDTGPAEYDVRIHRITYADGGRSRNRLPNGGFDSGLYLWAVYGEGKVSTPKSDLDDGRLLRLQASREQEIVINSYGISVTPGSAYTMTVTARVPPSGSISGYVAAIFLKESEIWRDTLKVVAEPIAPTSVETDADGTLSIDRALPPGKYRVRLSYVGDATHTLVSSDQEVTVS